MVKPDEVVVELQAGGDSRNWLDFSGYQASPDTKVRSGDGKLTGRNVLSGL